MFKTSSGQLYRHRVTTVQRVWDAATGAELTVLGSDKFSINSVVFSPDGVCIIVRVADSRTVRVWDAVAGAEVAVLRVDMAWMGDQVHSAVFSSDGRRIVTASAEAAQVWDAATSAQLAMLRASYRVINAAFSPDGTCILTVSDDGTARVWDAKKMEPTR